MILTVVLAVAWLVVGLLTMVVVGRAARIADLLEHDPRAIEIPDGVLVVDEDRADAPTVPDSRPAPEESARDRVAGGQ